MSSAPHVSRKSLLGGKKKRGGSELGSGKKILALALVGVIVVAGIVATVHHHHKSKGEAPIAAPRNVSHEEQTFLGTTLAPATTSSMASTTSPSSASTTAVLATNVVETTMAETTAVAKETTHQTTLPLSSLTTPALEKTSVGTTAPLSSSHATTPAAVKDAMPTSRILVAGHGLVQAVTDVIHVVQKAFDVSDDEVRPLAQAALAVDTEATLFAHNEEDRSALAHALKSLNEKVQHLVKPHVKDPALKAALQRFHKHLSVLKLAQTARLTEAAAPRVMHRVGSVQMLDLVHKLEGALMKDPYLRRHKAAWTKSQMKNLRRLLSHTFVAMEGVQEQCVWLKMALTRFTFQGPPPTLHQFRPAFLLLNRLRLKAEAQHLQLLQHLLRPKQAPRALRSLVSGLRKQLSQRQVTNALALARTLEDSLSRGNHSSADLLRRHVTTVAQSLERRRLVKAWMPVVSAHVEAVEQCSLCSFQKTLDSHVMDAKRCLSEFLREQSRARLALQVKALGCASKTSAAIIKLLRGIDLSKEKLSDKVSLILIVKGMAKSVKNYRRHVMDEAKRTKMRIASKAKGGRAKG